MSSQEIKSTVEELTKYITGKAIVELRVMLELMNESKPCKQFQLALMDLDAMAENLSSIAEDGYLPRLMEIPLSDSEIIEEFNFEAVQERDL